jgi:hypothetical protein
MLTYADVCRRIGASPDVGFGEDALFELYAQPGNDVRADYVRLFGAGDGARYSIFLLYWYRSTNSDAEGALVGLLQSLALKGWVFNFLFLFFILILLGVPLVGLLQVLQALRAR